MVMHWTLSLATAMCSASRPLCPRNLHLVFGVSGALFWVSNFEGMGVCGSRFRIEGDFERGV